MDTAGVHMWLDKDTTSPMMGQKNVYQKTPRIKMIIASEHQAKLRQKKIQEIDKKASKKSTRRQKEQ